MKAILRQISKARQKALRSSGKCDLSVICSYYGKTGSTTIAIATLCFCSQLTPSSSKSFRRAIPQDNLQQKRRSLVESLLQGDKPSNAIPRYNPRYTICTIYGPRYNAHDTIREKLSAQYNPQPHIFSTHHGDINISFTSHGRTLRRHIRLVFQLFFLDA